MSRDLPAILSKPYDSATFTREEIDAIQAEARRQGAEQERARIARSARSFAPFGDEIAEEILSGEWSREEVDDG